MGKNKKFAIIVTEEKNGYKEPSTIYADSVTDAMNFISLIKNKKSSIKIIDEDERLVHNEKLGPKDKENNGKGKGKGHIKGHGNGHSNSNGNGHNNDDDYTYA